MSTRIPSGPSVDNRTGYDRWAESYDAYVNSTVAIDDLYFPPVYAHLTGKSVLEIGCGTGRHTVRLAAASNQVTGVDLSPGMLAIAGEKLARHAVTLVEGDFLEMDLSGFDAVVSALVLEHINELDGFFDGVSKALVSGGELYLSEIHPDRISGGTQANFVAADGEAVRLTSFAHSEADIQSAAAGAGLRLLSHTDVFGGEALVRRNPDWVRHLGRAMIRIWTFEKAPVQPA